MKDKAKYKTFADVMEARKARYFAPEDELRLVYQTATAEVTLRLVKKGPGEDDHDEETLYQTESLETFLIEVADAFGWEGSIS